MKKSAIEVGKTYVNRAAGTTSRTVLDITEKPTDNQTPQWWSCNPRPVEPVVIFQAGNRPGFDSLYLSSFASWAGREK